MKIPKGHAYISTTLQGVLSQFMTDLDRDFVRECFDHWCQQCADMLRAKPRNEPESIAFTLHSVIDERVEQMRETSAHGRDIQCRKGCASCCHQTVEMFPQEAVLLHLVAREQGIVLDNDRLARQAKKAAKTWRELAPEDRACPFLGEDRACRVYEHRPAACRKYQVMTPPDLCDVDKHPGIKVGIVYDIEAEIIQSAAMTTFGAGTMAEMLLKHAPVNNQKRDNERKGAQ